MAFTAKKLLEVCASQDGHVGGNKYCDYFGRSDLYGKAWCSVFGCWSFANAGRNIGCWPNCGRVEAEGGVQAGMKKAGFKECKSLDEAGPGAALIINHHDDGYYIYDHFTIWCGTYSYNSSGVYCVDVWNGNASNKVQKSKYPVSHVERIWMPNFDSEQPAKDGWVKENGTWYFYENGSKKKNAWAKGTDNYAGFMFYLGSDGAPVTKQRKKIGGKYYCFAANGVLLVDCGIIYQGYLYYFGKDGAQAAVYKVAAEPGTEGAYRVTKL